MATSRLVDVKRDQSRRYKHYFLNTKRLEQVLSFLVLCLNSSFSRILFSVLKTLDFLVFSDAKPGTY